MKLCDTSYFLFDFHFDPMGYKFWQLASDRVSYFESLFENSDYFIMQNVRTSHPYLRWS